MTSNMPPREQLQTWLANDSPDLVAAVISDIQRHVSKLRAAGESFYGYAALPGDYWTQPNPASLVVAFNRESDIAAENSDDAYYRYSVDEWQNYVHDGFDATNSVLKSQLATFKKLHKAVEDDDQSHRCEIAFVEKSNRAILEALMALKKDGTFAKGTYLIIWFSDSDAKIMNQSAKLLNNASTYKKYASEFN